MLMVGVYWIQSAACKTEQVIVLKPEAADKFVVEQGFE